MLRVGQLYYPVLRRGNNFNFNELQVTTITPNIQTRNFSSKSHYDSENDSSTKEDVHVNAYETDIYINAYPPCKVNTILNVCPKGHVMMIERFGKLNRVQQPGLFFAIPFVDKIRYNVDMREITLSIVPQSGVTQDNVKVSVGGSLYIRIVDEEKACYAVRRVLVAIEQLAMSSMRTAIGKVDLDKLFHDRSSINHKIKQDMAITEEKWGVIVERYELRSINADQKVQEAMDLQSVAERDRRKEVLNAQAAKTAMIERSEGEKQQYINVAEGRKTQALLEAEALQQTILLEAQAKRDAIEMVAKTLQTPEGRRAQDFLLAKEYLAALTKVLPASKMNTIFLPNNLGDLPKLMGTAMGILDSNKNTENKD